MSDNRNRNTQFSGYAKLLYEELKPYQTMLLLALQSNDKREREWSESMIQTIIAQRSYDFAQHVLNSFELGDLETCDGRDEILINVPDLTAWPERQERGTQP